MNDIQLPASPTTAKHTLGKDYLLFVATGATLLPKPTWTLIGGQRNAPLAMKADEIDVSDKNSNGWKASEGGMKSWSIDLESILLIGDKGASAIKKGFLEGKLLRIMRWYKDGSAEVGWMSVTEYSDDTPHDDAASLKGTLNGYGEPEFLESVEDPRLP